VSKHSIYGNWSLVPGSKWVCDDPSRKSCSSDLYRQPSNWIIVRSSRCLFIPRMYTQWQSQPSTKGALSSSSLFFFLLSPLSSSFTFASNGVSGGRGGMNTLPPCWLRPCAYRPILSWGRTFHELLEWILNLLFGNTHARTVRLYYFQWESKQYGPPIFRLACHFCNTYA